MPWLGLALSMAFAVVADPKLAVNRWSGCAEVISGSPFPFYFEPCATAEWEVLLDRDGVQLAQEAQETQEAQEALQSAARAARAARAASPPSRAKSSVNLSEITADLKLPEAENLLGCTEHKLNFGGSIVLLQRGGCYFSWKVLLAEAAGAGAVLIFDTAPFQVTAILAVPGPFENPRIPGYLISRSQGEELLKRLDGGEEIQILCSWSAVDVWFNLPEHSLELNDSIILHNYGDEDMPWVVDMIDNNASFETDPFYTARVFGPDHATTFNETEMKNITVFNSSALDDDFHLLKLPFRFPHYLQFKDKVFVSANGVLVFDSVFSNIVGSIADSVAPAALIAPLWADLFGGAITGQGDSRRLVLRFEGFWLKPTGLLTEPSGPFTFDVWLFDDGEIHIHWETFPHSGWLELVEIGLEPGSGAKALPLKEWGLQVDTQNTQNEKNETQNTPNLTDFTDPFRSRSFSAVLVPWVKLSRSTDALPPNQFLTLNMTLPKTPSETTAWLFFYARKSLGTWHPRRNVRLLQRTFRHVWVLSGWDGGLHSGSCANGLVRRRTRRCVGSDGAEYDESHCIGSCEDITLEQNFDYPVRHVWKDGYNNRCEDYRALSFCNETGYGPKWQSWWGRFEDWVSGGPGAGEACCLCGGGRVSEPSGASGAFGAPVLSEKCPSVKCPVNSVGVDVLSGCSCQAGFEGEVIRSDQSPYFRGQCSPVACPLHSFGEHVADGCVCDAGYIGSIIPSKAEPFFTGSCREASTSASSSVTATRTGTRTSTASTASTASTTSTTSMHSLHEFTTGIPYTSARHETVSSTTSSISTSTESTARTVYMGTFPERRSVQVSATATTTSESPLSTIDFWTSTSFASFTLFTSSSSSSTDSSMANSPTSESQTSTEANLPFPALDNSTHSTQTKSSTGTTTRTITVGNRSTSSTPTTIPALSPEDSEYRQTHPQNSSTYTAQSAQSTQSQTSTLTFPTAGFSSAFTTSTSSTSTTFQTFTTSKVETMELVNEAGANVELSGAYEPPKAAFASTSRKVAAMVTQGSDGGPSTSALILLLLISTPCFACLCGAGRHLLARKAKSAAVHPEPEPSPNPASEPSEPSEPHVRIVRIVRPDWDAPDAPDAPDASARHCAPVTVRAAVHAEKERSDHVEISDM